MKEVVQVSVIVTTYQELVAVHVALVLQLLHTS